jgi:phosphoribosyl 1,2-cyclic phosphodiesterase
MPLFFQILASGSKGNALLVGSSKTQILLDAGLSGKELVCRLEQTPIRVRQLSAIVVSHEHLDHVRGLGVLSRRFHLPVYLNQGTLDHLSSQIGQLAAVQLFQSGVAFQLGDLRIHPFSISHDAYDPVGFVIEHEGSRLGVCTDLGVVTHLVRQRLQDCHGLVLEANHDMSLLLNGPYPPYLKQRIRSRNGHLSNVETCELLEHIYHGGLQKVLLAHLSEVNNRPDLVLQSVQELQRLNGWRNVRFEVGKQSEVSTGIEI